MSQRFIRGSLGFLMDSCGTISMGNLQFHSSAIHGGKKH